MKLLAFVLLIAGIATSVSAAELPAGHPQIKPQSPNGPAVPAQMAQKGTVLDVISVPQYTYLEVKTASQTVWLAAPSTDVKKGDTVRFDNGLVMSNFHSNALDRTFATILFVNHVAVGEDAK